MLSNTFFQISNLFFPFTQAALSKTYCFNQAARMVFPGEISFGLTASKSRGDNPKSIYHDEGMDSLFSESKKTMGYYLQAERTALTKFKADFPTKALGMHYFERMQEYFWLRDEAKKGEKPKSRLSKFTRWVSFYIYNL